MRRLPHLLTQIDQVVARQFHVLAGIARQGAMTRHDRGCIKTQQVFERLVLEGRIEFRLRADRQDYELPHAALLDECGERTGGPTPSSAHPAPSGRR